MTGFKKTILFMHRWFGFITGLVVFIVSITGCIFCFQDEIKDALYSYRKIKIKNQPYLAPSVLKQLTLKQYPGRTVSYLYYFGKNRPALVLASGKTDLRAVYFNPYTGVITHTENPANTFFVIVEYIHLYLLLPAKAGRLVVGISVILFLVIMITGILLWWPKRKSDRKRGFTIKWNGRWRRVNYDLHNVLGFYAVSISIILAITGLSIAFKWMTEAIYNTANLGKAYANETVVVKSDSLLRPFKAPIPVIDQAFSAGQRLSPRAEMFLIYDDGAASGAIAITAYALSLRYANSDVYSFDKYTGRLLHAQPNANKSPGMKLNDMNYDIHVGQVLGLTGKIIAFLASLVCASLPVTGFIIWLGKRNKPKKAGILMVNKFTAS